MRWKTRVACLGCAILNQNSGKRSPKSSMVALIVSKKTPPESRNGKSANRLTSNGCGTNRLILCWSLSRTKCTTLAQSWKSIDKSDQKCGPDSSGDGSSNFGISRNLSKCLKRGARTGGSLRNSSELCTNSPSVPQGRDTRKVCGQARPRMRRCNSDRVLDSPLLQSLASSLAGAQP